MSGRFSRVLREATEWGHGGLALMFVVVGTEVERTFAVARGSTRAPSCEDCFFGRAGLCALPEREPCATFRPNHPDGLRPPEQMRFVFRSERRTRAAWSFPTAQEQAALYA
jgi:hypothetical protein